MTDLGRGSRVVRLDTLCGAPIGLEGFLRTATGAASALGHLHDRNIVHHDIQPRVLEVDLDSGQVAIPDSPLPSPPALEARTTLAYVAPEQTGRMNRSVDSRADLYSLGVVFYQLLTGRLPFEASDPLEWVHCHIARVPRTPAEVTTDVPLALSEVVMKLLAKVPEDRYQSASGLRFDLEQCRAQWESTGRIPPFLLGSRDISERLRIPQRLYGREADVATLLVAFDRMAASGRPELLLVAGYSGIGKSSLVHELHKPIVRERAYFISGKFDQYKRDIPYATIAQALRELIQQVLTGSETEIARWKRELQEALGNNGQVIVEVIPQLGLILGPQPAVAELPPTEAQNRFRSLFRQFIGVFARREHPLALFLDDLQWADSGSLALIKDLVSHPDTRFLLVVGAFRDNEVTPSHPLAVMLDSVREDRVSVSTVALGPLSVEHLTRLLADALRCRLEVAEPLADLVHERTAGNPFFAIQFVTALHEERLLEFDHRGAVWHWDVERIRAKGFTNNVVDLMIAKLKRLPEGTRHVLEQVACLGNKTDSATLALVLDGSAQGALSDLSGAVHEGLLLRNRDTYQFLHDRVQEAAYSLIPEEERGAAHLRLGRLLLRNTPLSAVEERVFDIVNHLNLASGMMTDPRELEQGAELNLKASRRARAAAAFRAAADYGAKGLRLLGPGAWTSHHELAFALTLDCAECEMAGGNLEDAEPYLEILLAHTRTRLERTRALRVQIDLHTDRGQSVQALEAAIDCLSLYELDLAVHPGEEQVEAADRALWERIGGRPLESLADLPLMKDEEIAAVVGVLAGMLPSAYFADLHLHRMIAAQMVSLTLEHGVCALSPMGLAAYGLELCIRRRYSEASVFGRAALDLIDRHGFVAGRAKVCNLLGACIVPWTGGLRQAFPVLREGVRAGVESGDLIFACLCRTYMARFGLETCDTLEELDRETDGALTFIRTARYEPVAGGVLLLQRLVRALCGRTDGGTSLSGSDFDEAAFVEALKHHPLPLLATWYHLDKLRLSVLFGDLSGGLAAASAVRPLLVLLRGQQAEADAALFSSLAICGAWNDADVEMRAALRPQLEECAEHLRDWAAHCPQSFQHRSFLVSAEVARIDGRDLDAMRLYEAAITGARDHGFAGNRALADELAARFYRERGFETIAEAYLRNAHSGYGRWGARGKVEQLEADFPHLWPRVPPPRDAQPLDALALVKASQALSGQIILDELLGTLMRVVLEQSGAQRGSLLLADEDTLWLAAQARVEGEQVQVDIPQSRTTPAADLPTSILNYVRRSREKVILADAGSPSPFSSDEYLTRPLLPKSVLCLPILRQAQLVALLYLENSLVTDAFTPDRLAGLELLGSQAAISIENARLYADLEQENSRRQLVEADLREAEKKFRGIFENAVEGIFQSTPEGRLLTANPALARMLGFDSTDELVGLTDVSQLYLDPAHRREFQRTLEERGRVQGFITQVRSKDGRVLWLSVNARAARGPDGGILYYEGTAEDVTERRRSEQAEASLRDELEKAAVEWEHTFDSMETAILIVKAGGSVVRFNRAARHLAGPSYEGIAGRPMTELGPGEPWPSASEAAAQVEKTGGPTHGEVQDEVDRKTWDIAAFPSPGPTGAESWVIVVMRDITRTVQLQESLRRSETMSAMGMLVAGVAHEVRNPLFSISAMLDAFEVKVEAPSGLGPFTSHMRSQVERLAALMQDLLDYGKPAESARSLETIDAVVAEAVRRSAFLAARGKVRLVDGVLPGLPPVSMDHKRMVQVFENLLHNAILHSPAGGVVIVEAAREEDRNGDSLVLAVEDSGPGVPPADLSRIFEPFFTRRRGGTGLGLAIVHRIVDEHGGTVSAANRPRGGARMEVKLPCAGG